MTYLYDKTKELIILLLILCKFVKSVISSSDKNESVFVK